MKLVNGGGDVKENRTTRDREDPIDTGQTAYKRQLAHRCLGINPKDVQCVPFLANQLRRIARTVRGVDPAAAPVRPLEYLRNSQDPEARKLLQVYYSVPESYRRLLRPEDFCHAAGVSPWRVLEIITVVAVRQGAQSSAIVASILHLRVVAKTVEMALRDDGIRERRMLHKATGWLPARTCLFRRKPVRRNQPSTSRSARRWAPKISNKPPEKSLRTDCKVSKPASQVESLKLAIERVFPSDRKLVMPDKR